jgi:hypothetical protein
LWYLLNGEKESIQNQERTMPKFVPESWEPGPELYEWAAENFNIDDREVNRQLELMRDHEFRRSYTDWNRVFRNWIRKGDEIQSLRRPRPQYTSTAGPSELTPEQRAAEEARFKENLERLNKLRLVK